MRLWWRSAFGGWMCHLVSGHEVLAQQRAHGSMGMSDWVRGGWKIFSVTQSLGCVSVESFPVGAILKTTDGGLRWTRKVVNDPQCNANLEGLRL